MDMEIIDLKQNSQEWLDFRRNHVGASDTPILLGVSPWKTPRELYDEKLGLSSSQDNDCMRFGREKEANIRDRFNLNEGYQMIPIVGRSAMYPWMIASFDGLCQTNKLFIEIKCTNKDDHEYICNEGIPEKYQPQIIHQFIVSQYDKCILISHHRGEDFYLTIQRDRFIGPDFVNVIDKTRKFYEGLLSKTPPDLTEEDVIKVETSEALNALSNYKYAKQLREFYEEEERIAKEKLISFSQGKITQIQDFLIESIERKGSIQYDLVPALKGIDLEPYRKQTTIYFKLKQVSHENI